MDVAVTIAEYKDRLQALGYAEKTVEAYSWGLRSFEGYLKEKGIDDLRQVTKQVMFDYQASVYAGPHAVETKALTIRPVKRLFEHLASNNRLLINPAEGIVETKRRSRKIGPTLTLDEMKKVLLQPNMGLASGIRDRTIMEVLYATAMRIDELLSLHVHDVDLKDGVIVVRKGKGNKQRVVPLGKHATTFIKEYLDKVRPNYSRKRPKEQCLFLNNRGEPLSYGAVRYSLYIYARQAGIGKHAAPHTFRRSCATHMLQAGADIRYIQKLLGHARLATTQQYTKVMPVDIKKTHEETHPNGRDDIDSGIPETP